MNLKTLRHIPSLRMLLPKPKSIGICIQGRCSASANLAKHR